MSHIAAFEGATIERGRRTIVHNWQATISPGVTRIAGANGAGKSTILAALASNIPLTSGSCTVFGIDTRDEHSRALRNYVPQQPGLVPALSLAEHIQLATDAGAVRDEAERLTEDLRLDAWLDTPCAELSTGNLRKAWLTLCLARERPLILLDEPDDGLDTRSTEALATVLLRRIHAGTSVVLVSHRSPLIPVEKTITLPIE